MKKFKEYEKPLIELQGLILGQDILMVSSADNLETTFLYDDTDWL